MAGFHFSTEFFGEGEGGGVGWYINIWRGRMAGMGGGRRGEADWNMGTGQPTFIN